MRLSAADADRSMLIHLRWVSNQVVVVNSTVHPGPLKAHRPKDGALQLQLTDATGAALWTGPCEDPRVKHYEFPDAVQTNQLGRLSTFQASSDCMVRVPLKPGGAEVRILGEAPPPAVAPAGAGAVATTAVRPVLVRIPVPAPSATNTTSEGTR